MNEEKNKLLPAETFKEWSTALVEGVVLISHYVILPAMSQYQITTDNRGPNNRLYSVGYHGDILKEIVFLARPKGGSGQNRRTPQLIQFCPLRLPHSLNKEHGVPRPFLSIVSERFHPLLRQSPENAEEQLSGPPITLQSLRLCQTEIEDLAARAVSVTLQESLGSISVEAGAGVKILYTKVQQEIRKQLIGSSPSSWISEQSNVPEVADKLSLKAVNATTEHVAVIRIEETADTSSNASTMTCLDTTLSEVVSRLHKIDIGLNVEARLELVTTISCLFQERSPNQVEMSEDNVVSILTTACNIVYLVLENCNAARKVLGKKDARQFVKSGDANLSFFVCCLSKSLVYNAASQLKEMRQKIQQPQTTLTCQVELDKEDKTKTRSQGEKSDAVVFDIDLKQTADRMFAAIMKESSDNDDGSSRSTSSPLTALRQQIASRTSSRQFTAFRTLINKLPAKLSSEMVELLLNTPMVRVSPAQSNDLHFQNDMRLSKESLSDLLYMFIHTAFRNFLEDFFSLRLKKIEWFREDGSSSASQQEMSVSQGYSPAGTMVWSSASQRESLAAIEFELELEVEAIAEMLSSRARDILRETYNDPEITSAIIGKGKMADTGQLSSQVTTEWKEPARNPSPVLDMGEYLYEQRSSDCSSPSIWPEILPVPRGILMQKAVQNIPITDRFLETIVFEIIYRLSVREAPAKLYANNTNRCLSAFLFIEVTRLLEDKAGIFVFHEDDVCFSKRLWMAIIHDAMGKLSLDVLQNRIRLRKARYGSQRSILPMAETLAAVISSHLGISIVNDSGHGSSSSKTCSSDRSVSSSSEVQTKGLLPMTGTDRLSHPKRQRTQGLESKDPTTSGTKERKKKKGFRQFFRAAFCCIDNSVGERFPSTEVAPCVHCQAATTSGTEKKTLFQRVRASFAKAFSCQWIKKRSPTVASSF